jgi:hypothetical protein
MALDPKIIAFIVSANSMRGTVLDSNSESWEFHRRIWNCLKFQSKNFHLQNPAIEKVCQIINRRLVLIKVKTKNNHNVFPAYQFQFQINVLKALKINLFFSNKKLMAF